MAHDEATRREARTQYVHNRLALPAIAVMTRVPEPTLRRWKADAKQKGDDWDVARAASLVSGEGFAALIAGTLEEFVIQFRAVMDAVKDDRELTAADRIKLLSSSADAFNKTVAAAGRAAPKISELGVAWDVLKRLSDFATRTRPELAPALLELLEPFGDELAEAYDGR